jgi:hypothetical protein
MIVTDQLGGESHSRYQYLYDKLFTIYLDEHYVWTLAIYLTFILITGFTVLMCIRPYPLPSENLNPIQISHDRIILLAGISAITSYWIVQETLGSALHDGESGYILTRSTADELGWFRVHQVLNRVALVPTAIGVATLFSSGPCRLLTGPRRSRAYVGYASVLGGMFCFCVVLGNKNELALALFSGILFYLANSTRPQIRRLVTCGLVLFTGIAFVDHARRFPIDEIASNTSVAELADSVTRLVNSNEAFAAHMSLYGILSYEAPLTYGSSIQNFLASLVPRSWWPERPPDIYSHYATTVRATEGQGYCIHHAAGWYLNFGILGIVLGACLLGGLWASMYNNVIRAAKGRDASAWRIFSVVGFFTFTANIPGLIRNGPEGYKGILVESLIVPVAVLTLSRWQQSSRLRRPSVSPTERPRFPVSHSRRNDWRMARE